MTVITSTDLNNVSQQYVATVNTAVTNSNLQDLFAVQVDVKDFSSTTPEGICRVDFTPASDFKLWAVFFYGHSSTGTQKPYQVYLAPISPDQIAVPDYLLNHSLVVGGGTNSFSGGAKASFVYNTTSGADSGITLIGGVTYRLQLVALSANAMDRAVATLQLQTLPRRT